MSFSIVILSKNAENFDACIRAIYEHEIAPKIILVNDGVKWRWVTGFSRVVDGKKPFIFSRNANIGIEAAGNDDVIILNDDALLKTPKGFSALASASESHPEYGLIGSSCNNVGNTNQWPRGMGLRDEARMVCFVCVYIPRSTIEKVGLLDERFVGYGIEDDDYCLRVRNAGLKIGISDDCFVDHASLTSEFRGHGGGDFKPNLELFKRKWGMDNWGKPCLVS